MERIQLIDSIVMKKAHFIAKLYFSILINWKRSRTKKKREKLVNWSPVLGFKMIPNDEIREYMLEVHPYSILLPRSPSKHIRLAKEN